MKMVKRLIHKILLRWFYSRYGTLKERGFGNEREIT